MFMLDEMIHGKSSFTEERLKNHQMKKEKNYIPRFSYIKYLMNIRCLAGTFYQA